MTIPSHGPAGTGCLSRPTPGRSKCVMIPPSSSWDPARFGWCCCLARSNSSEGPTLTLRVQCTQNIRGIYVIYLYIYIYMYMYVWSGVWRFQPPAPPMVWSEGGGWGGQERAGLRGPNLHPNLDTTALQTQSPGLKH